MKETAAEIKAQRDRFKAAWEDERDYSSYTGTKKRALDVLDLSVELKRALPRTT